MSNLNLQDKIISNVYVSNYKMPPRPKSPVYPKTSTPEDYRAYADALEKYQAEMEAYRRARKEALAEENRLHKQFRADVEAEYGTAGNPKSDLLWDLAWRYGISSGLSEVLTYYDDLVDLIR